MLIFYERFDEEGERIAGILDVVDLESFADQVIKFLEEDSKIIILRIDKDGGIT